MTFRRVLVFALLIALARPAAGEGAAEAEDALAPARSAARARAVSLLRTAEIPGLAVAVGRDGRVVWSEGLGFADLEARAPVTTETRFRAASVSKVLTVAALARLVDAGVLDLDAPIARWLPELPEATGRVTLRQLAGHLGGIRHYERKDFGPDGIDRRSFASLEEALAIFVDDPLVAEPGTEYRYSTFGYTLLGAVMERAAGEPFLAILEEQVLGPLGMRDSGGDLAGRVVAGRSGLYHQVAGGEAARAAPEDPSYKWPGGGLLTSAEDLVRFGLAHLRPGYLSEASLAQLFVPQTAAGGESTGVGIGWRIGRDWRGRRIYHHSGSMSGARSSIVVYPDTGWVAAITSNMSGAPPLVESTLQMLVEPFLAAGESGPPTPRPGTYAWRGTAATREETIAVDGWLSLLDHRGSVRGAMSLPAPLFERLLADSYPPTPTLPVLGWAGSEASGGLVVATPLGIVFAPVGRTPQGLALSMEVGSVTLDLHAVPAPGPAEP